MEGIEAYGRLAIADALRSVNEFHCRAEGAVLVNPATNKVGRHIVCEIDR
jgi:hypothetical protein